MKGQFFGVFLFVFMERGNWPGFVPGSSGQGPARWMQIIEAPPRIRVLGAGPGLGKAGPWLMWREYEQRLQDSKTPESVRGTTCDVLASGPSVTTSRASGCSGYSKTEEGTSMLKKSWRDGKKGLAEDVEAPPRLIVWGRDARELNPNKVSATVSPLVNSRSRPPVLSSKVSEHPSGWRRIQNELGP
jgi:hypothetical protein